MIQAAVKYMTYAATAFFVMAAQADYRPLDLLPWPWGSECPFPWTKIEGTWSVRTEAGPEEKFTFEVTGTRESGTKMLEVRRFDGKGRLIGVGEGVAPRGEKIVRAVMTGVGPEEGNSYWAIVRTYAERGEKKKISCARAKLVTVITLRPTDGSSDDTHLIVDKDESSANVVKP